MGRHGPSERAHARTVELEDTQGGGWWKGGGEEMAHLKILPLVSFLLGPPCPLWLSAGCVRRMEGGRGEKEEETGRLVVVVFKAGWDWERRWDGGGPARVRRALEGRRLRRSRGLFSRVRQGRSLSHGRDCTRVYEGLWLTDFASRNARSLVRSCA
jgi:hypothetical protein